MKKSLRIALTVLLAFALAGVGSLTGCAPNENKEEAPPESAEPDNEMHEVVELQIFAANSLSKALVEVQKLYSEDHSWVVFSDTQFLASGDLVESLDGGAYADLLITASKDTMDTAEEDASIDPSTRFDMFSNDLVIVAKAGSGFSDVTLQDIAEGKYTVAIGDDAVPAGNYAAQALSTVGAYVDPSGQTGSEISGKGGEYVGIVPVREPSVGDACKKAETGEVDVAIVYSSDMHRFGGVEVVGKIAADTHKKVIYSVAICSDSTYSEEIAEFLVWATTDPEAIKIWREWGFEPFV